jgi:hypothetical protein
MRHLLISCGAAVTNSGVLGSVNLKGLSHFRHAGMRSAPSALLMGPDGAFTTGSDFLMDGGATASCTQNGKETVTTGRPTFVSKPSTWPSHPDPRQLDGEAVSLHIVSISSPHGLHANHITPGYWRGLIPPG